MKQMLQRWQEWLTEEKICNCKPKGELRPDEIWLHKDTCPVAPVARTDFGQFLTWLTKNEKTTKKETKSD